MKAQKGYLILEDGTVFLGRLLNGHEGIGEVVFNTSHSGYQEMATDPSYFKQILVTTAPMQGNYGVQEDFCESDQIAISSFVCLEMQKSERDSSWLTQLTQAGVPVLSEVDTRKLTLYLREKGSVWGGVFKTDEVALALKKIQDEKSKFIRQDWTALVSTKDIQVFKGDLKSGPLLGVLDMGHKKNILRELVKRSSEVHLFPSSTSAQEILETGVKGLLLSNGPGDPEFVGQPVETVKELIGQLPIMGICMGNQILGRALGVSTYKLKFGHRGANHPIKDHLSRKIYMSSQNHGYALKTEELEDKNIEITHTNLNDQTVSGIRLKNSSCFAVQFHPESHPGPHEAEYLFDDFMKMVSSFNSDQVDLKSEVSTHV